MIDKTKPNASLKEGRIFTESVKVLYTDLADAGVSQAVNVGSALPSDAVVLAAWFDLQTDFADAGSITNVALDVGVSGNTDCLIDNVELLASTPANERTQTINGDGTAQIALAGKQVIATFTATGANFGDGTTTALDAGEVDVCVVYTRISDIG